MNYGAIYKITNNETGKIYIGKSIDVKQRWKQHIYSGKFNEEEYTFKIIAEYESREDLANAEEYWIFRYNAVIKGYNKSFGNVNHLKKIERITFTVKPDFKELIDKIVSAKKYSSKSFYIKDLIRKDLESEGYINKIGGKD